MKNLKKVVLGGFAVVAMVAISFFSFNSVSGFANVNSQDEVTASTVQYASVIDWSDYDFNSSTEAEKCGAGKCGDDKKKAETKKDSKKCGEGKCGDGKCGGDKAKSEKKSEKCGGDKAKTEKKSEKCGPGKCGKA